MVKFKTQLWPWLVIRTVGSGEEEVMYFDMNGAFIKFSVLSIWVMVEMRLLNYMRKRLGVQGTQNRTKSGPLGTPHSRFAGCEGVVLILSVWDLSVIWDWSKEHAELWMPKVCWSLSSRTVLVVDGAKGNGEIQQYENRRIATVCWFHSDRL